MKRSASAQHQQAQWRERLARQAQSGQSVAAFCKSEGIPTPTFTGGARSLPQATALSLQCEAVAP